MLHLVTASLPDFEPLPEDRLRLVERDRRAGDCSCQDRASDRQAGFRDKPFVAVAGKYFAKRPVDAADALLHQVYLNRVHLDGVHLRLARGLVVHQDQRLQGIANMVIHEVNHPQSFAKAAQALTLIEMKDQSGDEATEKVVDDSLHAVEPPEQGKVICRNQQS